MNDKEHDSEIEIVPLLLDPEMTEEEQEIIKKVNKVTQLFFDPETNFPSMFKQFFDLDSEKLLDEKIAVLTELRKRNGKYFEDIPHFYDILELWSENDSDGSTYWD